MSEKNVRLWPMTPISSRINGFSVHSGNSKFVGILNQGKKALTEDIQFSQWICDCPLTYSRGFCSRWHRWLCHQKLVRPKGMSYPTHLQSSTPVTNLSFPFIFRHTALTSSSLDPELASKSFCPVLLAFWAEPDDKCTTKSHKKGVLTASQIED